MPKRKTPEPEPPLEPETFDGLFYRIHTMQDTYPDAVYERYKYLADYVEATPDLNDLAVTDRRIQRLVEPFRRAYAPWIRERREREGTGEEAFRAAVKAHVDTLTDLVEQGGGARGPGANPARGDRGPRGRRGGWVREPGRLRPGGLALLVLGRALKLAISLDRVV